MKRSILLVALFGFTAPAAAEPLTVLVSSDGPNPWAGIAAEAAPQVAEMDGCEAQSGPSAAEAAPAAADDATSGDIAAAELPPAADEEDQHPTPSLWNSLDLAVGADDEAVPEAGTAPAATHIPTPHRSAQSLPTHISLANGPASLEIAGSVATTAPVSAPLGGEPGGGSGEINGRIGYEADRLTVYGASSLGAAETTGVVSIHDRLALGSRYELPLGGSDGGRFGAKLEIDETATVTTGVEYRAGGDGTEGYVSVESVGTPDAVASGAVRAGLAQKF